MKKLLLLCFVLIAGSAFAQNNNNTTKDTCAFVVPNVVSPNSNIDHLFVISANCYCVEFKMTIFNRWGKEMYKQETLNNFVVGWDYLKAQEGVYYWMIEAKFQKGSDVIELDQKGNITVLH
ncbi:MAG: gliding motility-associated C-terminal domain-containing protein [Bacteroidota bacterium]